jgi:hypothetical protein
MVLMVLMGWAGWCCWLRLWGGQVVQLCWLSSVLVGEVGQVEVGGQV